MNILLNGKKVRLAQNDMIGMGGEATIFRQGGSAIKIYSQPSPARAKKLSALIGTPLPPTVVAPQALAYDSGGKNVVGFAMPLLDSNYTEVRKLSLKNYRAASKLTARGVAQLFLSAHHTLESIHQAGLVVGDFNDLNLMFRADAPEMHFIDTDSFQLGTHPCMVGTEAFLDPQLYGIDLAQKPAFKPENDWYSFAVLLFKSLLLTHPYGGVHPSLHTLTERALQRVSALDPSVKYPRIGYNPQLLSDDLTEAFEKIFSQGERRLFSRQVLQHYHDTLISCPTCQADYPNTRPQCPICAAAAPIVFAAAVPAAMAGAAIQYLTLLQVAGQLVAWSVEGGWLRAVAHEQDQAVYYALELRTAVAGGRLQPRRIPLFKAVANARYAFLESHLVVAPPNSDELLVIDLAGGSPVGLFSTSSGRFGGGETVFGTSARSLYRLAGGYLMRGQIANGQLLESALMAVAEQQTWFKVDSQSERAFGCFRTLRAHSYWLLAGEARLEVSLPPLEADEFVLEHDVCFAPDGKHLLVYRHTQLHGVERVRLEAIDSAGRLLSAQVESQADAYQPSDAHAYFNGVLLRPTDSGLVQMRLGTTASKRFAQTEPLIGLGDGLCPHENGLLVGKTDRILWVTL
jgi:hypothetical protein